jgi:NACHT domain
MFATLATTIEIKSDVKDLSVIAKQNLKVGMETLSVSKEGLNINIDTNALVKNGVAASKESADGVKVLIKYCKDKKREEDA